MPHVRKRLLCKIFLKQLKLWPVVGLLGPRQCGKSTFLRELVWKPGEFSYITLDRVAAREQASRSPELFLTQNKTLPFVIDEIQKAPPLFDEIKAIVDQKRIPGKFVLSGSVQFSRKTGIRESLTGRIATLRLDTMTLQETHPHSVNLTEIQRYLKSGGMPAICFLRDQNQRRDAWEQWLDTLCERDIRAYGSSRLSPDLARRILELSAQLDLPTVAAIAHEARVDARRINTHVEALRDLFVIHTIQPNPNGVGKALILPFDAGLATYLGAGLRRQWQVWFITEWNNQHRHAGLVPPRLDYYLTSRGSHIDFSSPQGLHHFSDLPSPDRRTLMTLAAARKKIPKSAIRVYCATDSAQTQIDKNIISCPWSTVADLL